MANDRRRPTSNENMLLYSEVEGLCPLCTRKLSYTKNGQIVKTFEVAHIYPLNPTVEEIRILSGEERLSKDVNSLENLIALCSECHKKFDTPRTVEEYRYMVGLKKSLTQQIKTYDQYFYYPIEEDIKKVIMWLASGDIYAMETQTTYDLLKIDQKDDGTIKTLTKRRIKNDVSEYYIYIKDLFSEIEKDSEYSFESIAQQIKSMNTKLKQQNLSREQIYIGLSDWLNRKTGNASSEACKIVISFFVQNCEALS